MSAIGCHVVAKLQDGRVIAGDPLQRRLVAQRVLSTCRSDALLVFHLVDSHLHLLLAETTRRSLALARRLESSLSQLLTLPVPFAPAYPEPVRNQTHLYRAFEYILRQQSHHGLDWDPYFDASSLSDLLGLRTVGAYTANHVRQRLPRVTREVLLGHLGVTHLATADGPPELLREATLAAAGLLSIRPLTVAAREAVVAAISVAGGSLSAKELAQVLDISQRSIERHRASPINAELVQAIRRQMGLRSLRGAVPAGEE